MNLEQLRDQIEEMPLSQRADYRKVFSYSAVGGKVWPQLADHLERAETVKEFLENIYEDDNLRFEAIWAYWAKMSKKRWVSRFEPAHQLRGMILKDKGLIVTGKGNELLIPVPGRGRTVDVFVFEEDGFNADAAELYGSINGTFECYGLVLEGTFDVYRSERSVIFERWAFDKLGRRVSTKRRCQKSSCSCCS